MSTGKSHTLSCGRWARLGLERLEGRATPAGHSLATATLPPFALSTTQLVATQSAPSLEALPPGFRLAVAGRRPASPSATLLVNDASDLPVRFDFLASSQSLSVLFPADGSSPADLPWAAVESHIGQGTQSFPPPLFVPGLTTDQADTSSGARSAWQQSPAMIAFDST